MAKVTAIIIGAGNRGSMYAGYGLDSPETFQVVGVAEPRKFYRERLQNGHNISAERTFESWEQAAAVDKFADCVIITTQDKLHRDPAVAFAKKGYHILLEKPMATTYQDCVDIVEACSSNNVILAVGHVLRYTPQAKKIKELIESGVIGDVVNIQHMEPIGFFHYAHSYVRGNWRNSDSSSFALLAKSCHDLDLIQMWMGRQKCTTISSFGSLKHFTSENKPAGASSRCMDCAVEYSCPYSAVRIYCGDRSRGIRGWPVDVVTEVPDIESLTRALKTGPYGRCVYECDNNVVDNQVVNMQFEGGATVSFSMVAFTERLCERQVKIFGTKGELSCSFEQTYVRQFDFLTRRRIVHDIEEQCNAAEGSRLDGHGGADFHAMSAFVQAVATGDRCRILTGPQETLRSHLLCFAAEKSRLEKRIVDLTTETNYVC